jgi:tetratricopeptide (TPR) repeat protein
VFVIAVIAVCSGIYYFNKVKPYNDIVASANKAMDSEDYDKAVKLYKEAQTYKKTNDTTKNIQLAGVLKKSKSNYNAAVEKMNRKDYIGAIDDFKKVDKQDKKRYKESENKIEKCRKLYVDNNLKLARNSLNNNNFDDANKYLANILKIDSNNSEVKKLKEDIAKALEKKKQESKEQSSSKEDDSYTSEMAINLMLKIDRIDKNNPDLSVYCDNVPYYNSSGKKYYFVILKSKSLLKSGGSGTLDSGLIAKDGSMCSWDDLKK